MPDRIYTYQQSMIIMKIEELEYLMSHHRKTARRQINTLYKSIVRRSNNEVGLPDRLRYKTFFDKSKASNAIWKKRITDEKLSDWLVELHRYYDDVASRTAPR